MKKIALALVVALAGLFTLAAEDAELFVATFSGPNKGYYVWCNKGMAVDNQMKDGKAVVTIKESGAEKTNGGNIQFIVAYNASFKAGAKYRAEATVVSSVDFQMAASVFLNKAPWTGLAGKSFNLKADQPQKIEVPFSPKEDVAGSYRVPCLNLGTAPVGAVIEVSDVKVFEIK